MHPLHGSEGAKLRDELWFANNKAMLRRATEANLWSGSVRTDQVLNKPWNVDCGITAACRLMTVSERCSIEITSGEYSISIHVSASY